MSEGNLSEISGTPRRVPLPEAGVTITVGEHTAIYASAAEAVQALFAALPRKQRKILWWMETLRRINQAEAGIEPKGKAGENVVQSVRG